MFDTEKIRRITTLLGKMPEEFDDVYIVPEIFTQEAATLFRRLKIPVKGIMHDTQPGKEMWGIPIVKTAEVVENFNERTILILLTEKPVPLIQTTFDFRKREGVWTIPALVIADDEVKPIYDRLTVLKILKQYKEDGIPSSIPARDLPERFARGLTTQGVRYVKENTPAKFVLKTRTDQRINLFSFLVYFKNLLETFPPKGDKLRERIIFLNSNMTKSFPFYFNDYLSFGHVEDIFKLYAIPLHGNCGEMTYAFKNIPRLMRLKNMLFAHPADYRLVTKPSRKLYMFNIDDETFLLFGRLYREKFL